MKQMLELEVKCNVFKVLCVENSDMIIYKVEYRCTGSIAQVQKTLQNYYF